MTLPPIMQPADSPCPPGSFLPPPPVQSPSDLAALEANRQRFARCALAEHYWAKPQEHTDAQEWCRSAQYGNGYEDSRASGAPVDSRTPIATTKTDESNIEEVVSKVNAWLSTRRSKDVKLENIALLELSHFFEYFLWPHFHHSAAIDVSASCRMEGGVKTEEQATVSVDYLILMVALLNQKIKEGLPVWSCFTLPVKETFVRNSRTEPSAKKARDESSDNGGKTKEDTQIEIVDGTFYAQKFEHFFYCLTYACMPVERLGLNGASKDLLEAKFSRGEALARGKDRISILRFLIYAFQSFEEPMVVAACMKVCGPFMWGSLSAEFREGVIFEQDPNDRIMWNEAHRVRGNESVKSNNDTPPHFLNVDKIRIETFFMPSMLFNFLELIDLSRDHSGICEAPEYSETVEQDTSQDELEDAKLDVAQNQETMVVPANLIFSERFIEWLIDLLSQEWSRSKLHPVLIYNQVLPRIKLSALAHHDEGALFNQLVFLLEFYEKFEIDFTTGESLTPVQSATKRSGRVWDFQKICFDLRQSGESDISSNQQALLETMYLTHVAKFDNSAELRNMLRQLDPKLLDCISRKVQHLGLPDVARSTDECGGTHDADVLLLLEILAGRLDKRDDQVDQINETSLYPTEALLWDTNLVPTEFYQGDTSLALPKLNLQFLTIHDYLLRNYNLLRLESTYEVREDIEKAVRRMGAKKNSENQTVFDGSWPMALPMEPLNVTLVEKPKIGQSIPSEVRAEITINLAGLREEVKEGWNNLRQFDVLMLVGVIAPEKPTQKKGKKEVCNVFDYYSIAEFPETFGVVYVRGAEIYEVVDEAGTVISDQVPANWKPPVGDYRTLRVFLDPYQYSADIDSTIEKEESLVDIYGSFNLVVRREPRANNFKAILATIRSMMNNAAGNNIVPDWLYNLLLGYGDPKSAHYRELGTPLPEINFLDTFLDKDHLLSSFPNSEIVVLHEGNENGDFSSSTADEEGDTLCKLQFNKTSSGEKVTARRYKKTSIEKARMNTVRFSAAQVEAIRSGSNPGLTMIVGPPGTGKTDTAVQIVNLLSHNFPNERVLLIAHSNQALNELFSKIIRLDISERYLLRLGLGEKDVESGKDFSKWGRVSYMLERRLELLNEASKLATSLNVHGDVGLSCESARQFYEYQIMPKIQKFYGHIKALKKLIATGDSSDFQVSSSRADEPGDENEKELERESMESITEKAIRKIMSLQSPAEDTNPTEPVFQKPAPLGSGNDSDVEEFEDESDNEETPKNSSGKTGEKHKSTFVCELIKQQKSLVSLIFPFTSFFAQANDEPLFPLANQHFGDSSDCIKSIVESELFENHFKLAESYFSYIVDLFIQLRECHAFELLRTTKHRAHYLLTKHAKVVAMTCTHAALTRDTLVELNFKYDSLIIEEAAQILEVETFIPLLLQQSDKGVSRLKRVVLIGDHNQLPPIVKNRALQQYSRLDQSLFSRFIRLAVPYVELDKQGRARPTICDLYRWRYKSLKDLDHVSPHTMQCAGSLYECANAGVCFDYQFIDVQDYQGVGEVSPMPFVYENLGEAEYCVTFFMYLRLLGYPASRISILTTYNGQLRLLKNVVKKRCSRVIGEPAIVSTVDKYQGQQNDYIILSLVRSKKVGHIRDVRRLIVAMSRARLGLYVFGRYDLYEQFLELAPVFEKFAKRPTKLALLSYPEAWPSKRPHNEVTKLDNTFYVEGVVHMYHIMQSRATEIVEAMKAKAVS